MTNSLTDIETEQLWYLDFSENQHLQALSNLSDQIRDPKLKAHFLKQRQEVDNLVQRRKQLLQNISF